MGHLDAKLPGRQGAARVELVKMRVKVTPGGYEQYGAWREGSHDDLVLAVALGHWGMRHVNPELGPGQEGHWQHPFLRF
jgi:hypothetical protein